MATVRQQHGRFRRASADVLGLFVLPGVLALLPWSFSFRLLRCFANRLPWFRPEADAAYAGARTIVPIPDAEVWKRNYRLVRWIERCDSYLTLLRGRRWWRARIDIEGTWPHREQPCLFLTYHWGAGNWVWRCLRDAGFHAYFVARKPEIADMGVSRVAAWYARFRGWSFARTGGLGVLYTGGSRHRIRDALRAGDSIVGMLDLPVAAHQPTREVSLLGRAVRLPSGLLDRIDVACATAIFSCAIDLRTGRRCLRIEPLGESEGVETMLQRYAAHLDARLRENPEYWMMWHESSAIFAAR